MEASAILTVLSNAGGLGILAAALFYLHIRSLRIFSEEMAKERSQCHQDHEKIMASVGTLTRAVAHVVVQMRNRASGS